MTEGRSPEEPRCAEADLRDSEARCRALAEALRKSEERLRLSQEAGGVGLFDWNLATGEVYWSPSLRDLIGVGAGEAASAETWDNLLHPEDRTAARAAVAAVLADGGKLDVEFRIVRPADGRTLWLASRGEAVLGEDGAPARLVGVNYDVSARKFTEAALWESSERLQLAMRAAELGDWRWDAESDLVTMSERAAAIFGIPPGPHLTWTAMRDLLHPADAERAAAAVSTAVDTDGHYDIEYRLRRPADGREILGRGEGPADLRGRRFAGRHDRRRAGRHRPPLRRGAPAAADPRASPSRQEHPGGLSFPRVGPHR